MTTTEYSETFTLTFEEMWLIVKALNARLGPLIEDGKVDGEEMRLILRLTSTFDEAMCRGVEHLEDAIEKDPKDPFKEVVSRFRLYEDLTKPLDEWDMDGV
jgi:hypothetical protein